MHQPVRRPLIVYALLPLVVSGVMVIAVLRLADPSTLSKALMVGALAASLCVWWRYPDSPLIAVLRQAGVSLYVLIYLFTMKRPPNTCLQTAV